jgi:arginyl-tRNA synthetase
MPSLSPFRQEAAQLVAGATDVAADRIQVSSPPNPELGDFSVRVPAKDAAGIAKKLADEFKPTDRFVSARADGAYLNLKANPAALFRHVTAGEPFPKVGLGKTIIVDFSSPNIAKPLAYHHIRSTVIGNALVGLNRALGYRVVGINHLGDWGTSFGKILAGIKQWGLPDPLTIDAVNDLYKRYDVTIKEAGGERADNPAQRNARLALKELEDGVPATRALWQRIRDVSLAEFQEIYDLLGVKFDAVMGESEYESMMQPMIDYLQEEKLTSISDGALVVDLTKEGIKEPLILKTQDGTTVYATRDLAAARYRFETYHFHRALYVVDRGQAFHFKQLFATLKKAGFTWADSMKHVPFGLVRMQGKKTSTRAGNVVLLKEVLEEAMEKIRARLVEDIPDAEKREKVAHEVGVGAIIFANLASQREKDVDFSMEQITSFEGDAGPYVQYTHARASSILRRATLAGDAPIERLGTDQEWALAKILADAPDEIARAAADDAPHIAVNYLLEVCKAFSRWYTAGNADPSLKVICDDPATTQARLALTAATKRTLASVLGMLGISAPDEM